MPDGHDLHLPLQYSLLERVTSTGLRTLRPQRSTSVRVVGPPRHIPQRCGCATPARAPRGGADGTARPGCSIPSARPRCSMEKSSNGSSDNERRAGNLLSSFGILCAVNGPSRMIGHRVLIDGMMGSGKSTFARELAARTGLPVIHLDVHYWKPGWVRPSDDEWRDRQRELLAGKAWITEGNYNETLALRLERAETVVFLDTPWWLCASSRACAGASQARRRDARGLRGLGQATLARRVVRRREDLAQPPFRT